MKKISEDKVKVRLALSVHRRTISCVISGNDYINYAKYKYITKLTKFHVRSPKNRPKIANKRQRTIMGCYFFFSFKHSF